MNYKGSVQKGGGYGRTLGFPTANISFEGAESGIYAAEVAVEGNIYFAAVYVDEKRKVLESHLFGFDGDLYGKEIRVELKKKLRDGREFSDENEARAAIAEDVEAAKAYFSGVN